MITAVGLGINIRGFLVQTLTVNVGAGKGYFLFRDPGGANGPVDVLSNLGIWNENKTGEHGDLYGIHSPNIKVMATPFYNYMGATVYKGLAYPYDETVHHVIDVTQR